MWGSHGTHRICALRKGAPVFLAGLVAVVLLGSPTNSRASETIVTLMPVEPATTVWMLAAPHIGKKMCEVPGSAKIRFIARANHGPHRYARIEVLEGDCAGKQGYVPWSTVDPEPQED